MPLRVRLNLLLSLILCATFAVGVAYLLADVRRAVLDELNASSELATTLLQGVLDMPLRDEGATQIGQLTERLTRDAAIRHLRFEMSDKDGVVSSATEAPRAARDAAPLWFATLARPAPGSLQHSLPFAHGHILIVADPDDEIAEAWRETKTTLSVLFAIFAAVNLMVFLFLGRALKPLVQLAPALEGIERGQFATRVPRSGLADIDALIDRFNHMAAALADSHAANLELTQRSLKIQEQERRHLAHELHDELGQSITAIKALAVSIGERLEASDPTLAERATIITEVSSDIYTRVRRMMARLHPVVLDELGLVAAIELMVDDWNSYHADCFCSFVASRELPTLKPAARIGLYRIAQEALTNVARHAAASEARMALVVEQGARSVREVALSLVDNGRGFDVACQRRGLGLVGIQERIETLGGQLEIESTATTGTHLRARAPLVTLCETEHEHD